jgi:hypothetical protein
MMLPPGLVQEGNCFTIIGLYHFDTSSDSGDSDDDSDSDLLFDDEEQHPPEYYQAEADSLDVLQLCIKTI